MVQNNRRNLTVILASATLVLVSGACGAPEQPPAPDTTAPDALTALDEGLRDMQDMRPNVLECLAELEICLTDGGDAQACREELAELCRPPHPGGDGPRGDRPDGEGPDGDRPPRGEGPDGDRPEGDRPPRGEGPEGDRPEGDRPPRGERPEGERPEGDRPERGEMARRPMPNLRPCFEGLFSCVEGGELGACFEEARTCVETQLDEHHDNLCERGLAHCADEQAPADRCEALADRCAEGLPE